MKNEAIVRRLMEEVYNHGRLDLLTELISVNHLGHDPFGDHFGPEGLRITISEYRNAFPDFQLTIEDLFTKGDKVVNRFTFRGTHLGSFLGIPATARMVIASGIAIDRL